MSANSNQHVNFSLPINLNQTTLYFMKILLDKLRSQKKIFLLKKVVKKVLKNVFNYSTFQCNRYKLPSWIQNCKLNEQRHHAAVVYITMSKIIK